MSVFVTIQCMSDLYLRIVLFLSLAAIALTWTFTSPKNFFKFLSTLPQPRYWIMLGYQLLPFLQLGDVVRVSWMPNAFSAICIFSGIIILWCGIILAAWAKIVMKTNWGRPGQHDIRKQHTLVTGGPFGYTRNPIYLGLILVFLGFELAMQSY